MTVADHPHPLVWLAWNCVSVSVLTYAWLLCVRANHDFLVHYPTTAFMLAAGSVVVGVLMFAMIGVVTL